MPAVANIVLWLLSSGAVAFAACRFVNRRLAAGATATEPDGPLASGQDGAVATASAQVLAGNDRTTPRDEAAAAWLGTPYAWGVPAALGAAVLVALTAACAYLVALRALASGTQPPEFISVLLCYLALLASALIDAKLRVIPNALSLGLVVVRALMYVWEFFAWPNNARLFFVTSLVGLASCFLVLTLTSRLSRGGIGGGDIKLVSAVGFGLGVFAAVFSLTLGLVVFAVVALVLLVLRRKHKGDSLPFAPFLYAGYVCALLLGLY